MFNYLKSMIYSIGIILIGAFIITILNYFNILTGTVLRIIELIIPVIAIFVGSYKIGKVSDNKGYIEGIKYGIIWIIILLIINLIMKSFTPISIIYLVILLFISVVGSIFGINRKKS